MLAGPIVMIATHRVAKQSWRFWCKVAVVASIYDFKYRGCNLRRLGNVLSSVSCIKDEWQFRRLGRQYCRSLLFDCGRKRDPANRKYLTSQAIREIWIVGHGCFPDKRYWRIQTCLPGKVESFSSPIRRQTPDVKYPEKVERRSGRMAAIRHPDKSGVSRTEFLPGWNELWFPSEWNELWFHASKGRRLRVQERGSHLAIFGEDPTMPPFISPVWFGQKRWRHLMRLMIA